MHAEQRERMRSGKGFIAALDQSGGSTPKALKLYGISDGSWKSDEEMFDLIHAMRTRMMTSSAFDGRRVLGAILFEGTMDRTVDGLGSANYLWSKKSVVPFVKVDQGLADEADGVQMMKPLTKLDGLLDRAVQNGIFGTKMRSVIAHAHPAGIKNVVAQQFDVGRKILARGLVPIIEPEVDIKSATKAEAERILHDELLAELDRHPASDPVMLKLTLPTEANFYAPLVAHPSVLRVVALSGGYSREESNRLLALNNGVIASFSRALTEGLSAQQSDADFDRTLDATIVGIYQASLT